MFNFFIGFLAKKHIKEFPELACYTRDNEPPNKHSYSIPSWVQSLSFGGLMDPSEEWYQSVLNMDKHFTDIHKTGFAFKTKIIEHTTSLITKEIKNVPEILIQAFVRQRVFIRIKYQNTLKKLSQLYKRSLEHNDSEHVVKKMRKIV